MPTAASRPCAGGCGVLVTSGRCRACARSEERQRGTATYRGYDVRWIRFRRRFFAALTDAGHLPVCGAVLADGPRTQDSDCASHGWQTFQSADGSSLHVDHEPPLTDAERQAARLGDRRAIDDLARVQLLCASCHDAKTAREPSRGAA